ncbi:hypothetical protein Tco_0870087 [Tanacetum coccineum]
MSAITDKLKNLNRDMQNLKKNVHAIKGRYKPGNEIYYLLSEEVKCVKATECREDSLMVTPSNKSPSGNSPKLKEILGNFLEGSCKRQDISDEYVKRFREITDKNLRRHDSAIKGLEENVARLAQVVKTNNKLNQGRTLDMRSTIIISPLSVNSNLVHCTKSAGQEIVKRRIKEEQENGERLLESLEKEPVNTLLVNTIRQTPDYTKCLQELVSEKTKTEEVSMVRLNARCLATLQNELPPKEKDP